MSITGTGSILGQALAQDVATALGTGVPSSQEIALWTVVANRLISHIVANALVTTTDRITGTASIIAPVGGGPCTGIGTGSGTGGIS